MASLIERHGKIGAISCQPPARDDGASPGVRHRDFPSGRYVDENFPDPLSNLKGFRMPFELGLPEELARVRVKLCDSALAVAYVNASRRGIVAGVVGVG